MRGIIRTEINRIMGYSCFPLFMDQFADVGIRFPAGIAAGGYMQADAMSLIYYYARRPKVYFKAINLS